MRQRRNNAIAIVCLAYAMLLPLSTLVLQSSTAQADDDPKVAVVAEAAHAAPHVAVKERTTTSRLSRPVSMVVKLKGRRTISSKELFKLLADVGFTGRSHKIAYALVMRESHGHARSHNNNRATGDNSYGLFQINMIGNLGSSRRNLFNLQRNSELLDPVVNAQAAYYMSSRGKDFSAWGLGATPYRSGRGEDTISGWYDDYERTKAKVMKENL